SVPRVRVALADRPRRARRAGGGDVRPDGPAHHYSGYPAVPGRAVASLAGAGGHRRVRGRLRPARLRPGGAGPRPAAGALARGPRRPRGRRLPRRGPRLHPRRPGGGPARRSRPRLHRGARRRTSVPPVNGDRRRTSRHYGQGVTLMDIAALILWLVTAVGGFVLLGTWVAKGGHRPGSGTRLTPPLVFGHVTVAVIGLVLWIIFLVAGAAAWAWIAFVLLLVVALFGFTMFGRWLSSRRSQAAES